MNDTSRKRLLGDGVHTFALRGANLFLALALNVLVARGLGPTSRGLYAFPGIDAAIVIVGFSGLNSATAYFFLRQNAGKAAIGAALATALGFTLAGIVVVGVLAYFQHQLWTIGAACAILPFSAVLNVLSGYYNGTMRVRAVNIIAASVTAATLAAMGIAFALFKVGVTPALYAWVVGTALVSSVGLILMLRESRLLNSSPVRLRDFVWYAAKNGSLNLVNLLNYRIDVYVVALLVAPAQFAFYTLAVGGAETALVVTQVVSLVALPHISKLNRGESARFTAACARNTLAIALAACAMLAIFAPIIVSLLYGARFAGVALSLRVLLAGVVFVSIGSGLSTFFTLQLGRVKTPMMVSSISACICLLGTIILVPRVGIVGAALSSSIAYLVGQSLLVNQFCKATGFRGRDVLLLNRADILRIEGWIKSLRQRLPGSRYVNEIR